ncbi:tetratricopeptide repeat protein [Vibrio phage vB_VpS_PG07]|uniref:Tetratricopeptide repeat protein n=1 Tax=Vibrio phage vB_VpS_PG07 TaxID=2301664 RepID=A0A385E7D9_9CAUD|nr:tetratricopeptide repeat protein [Vibrio phage vB_VpS_PG07]AXQ66777.1 tetratricopeptide repeat protein [Vibrio phage vB_VpS_PG07]
MKASNLVALANIIETNASDYAVISITDNAIDGLTVVLERVDSGHVLTVQGDTLSELEQAIINGVQPF